MDQPKGFIIHGQEKKVCKLIRSLYELKQTPKQWHDRFRQTLIGNGFTSNDGDICIYSKTKGESCVIISLYVNDMLIFGTSEYRINDIKKFLSSVFDIKDLRVVEVILGIKIIRDYKGIVISQSK